MKSNYRNYFKNGKLYQWNKENTVYTISNVNTDLEFCLDKFGMDLLLKFNNPTINLENNQLKIESGTIKASIPTIQEALMIPRLAEVSEEQLAIEPEKALLEFELPIETLKYAINFVGTDIKKPILTGVNIGNKCVNASDSFSAYSKEFNIDPAINITIPKTFIDELGKATKGTIQFKTDKKVLYARVDDTEYYSVLLEGNFPNVAGLFAKVKESVVKEITIDKATIQDILNYVMISDGNIILSDYQIAITGENTNIQSMCALNMDEMSIILSLAKVRIAIAVIEDNEINLKIKSDKQPLILNDNVLLLPKTQ